MTTPGQSITTPEDVLVAALGELRTYDGLNDGNCYIVDEPVFPSSPSPGDTIVQLSIGGGIDALSAQGDGLSKDEVRLTVFKRLLTDQDGQDTERITSESLGVLSLMRGIAEKLTNNFLPGGILLVPFRPLRREKGSGPGGPLGWARADRVFEVIYRVNYPDYTNQS